MLFSLIRYYVAITFPNLIFIAEEYLNFRVQSFFGFCFCFVLFWGDGSGLFLFV